MIVCVFVLNCSHTNFVLTLWERIVETVIFSYFISDIKIVSIINFFSDDLSSLTTAATVYTLLPQLGMCVLFAPPIACTMFIHNDLLFNGT